MSASEFNIDTFLSDLAVVEPSFTSDAGSDFSSGESFKEPGYEGSIDYRIRQLSYSSLLLLHSCPRKFQLNRLRTTHRTEESLKSTITFAFGHVVGEAIASALEGRTEQEILWRIFVGWHTDFAASDDKAKKSIYNAVIAYQRLRSLLDSGFLSDYELVYHDGKPATELSFVINFPDSFRLRGFVDAVLRHKETGEILVLECKTTGSTTVNPATYKNSAQAIGYSIVLDTLFPSLSSYTVLYLVYQTSVQEYTPIPFVKTLLQRALWIRELLLDIETIKMYEQAEVYPMHGESCIQYYKEVEVSVGGTRVPVKQGECEYLATCTLSTQYLTKPCTPEEEDKTEYQISLSLDQLLESQFSKLETQ